MPKKGIHLSGYAAERIKEVLKDRGIPQEVFAREIGVSDRTLRNWLTGSTSLSREELDQIVREVGIGVADLFGGDIPDGYDYSLRDLTVGVIRESNLLNINTLRTYARYIKALFKHLSLNKWPSKGVFCVIRHDAIDIDYYPEIVIRTERDVDEATFVISYILGDILRIDYGEIVVRKESVTALPYFQRGEHVVRRPPKEIGTARIATWFSQEACDFILSSHAGIPFSVAIVGKLTEPQIEAEGDVATFWRGPISYLFKTEREQCK